MLIFKNPNLIVWVFFINLHDKILQMKFKLLSIVFIAISFSFYAQEEEILEDNSVKGQFEKIFRTSTTYKPLGTPKKYKVIDLLKYQQLKSNVLDSLNKLETLIHDKENTLKIERDNIKKTKETLDKTKSDLIESNKKENSISLFGIQLSKLKYNLLLWSIIIVSLIALFYFIFKFSKSNILTKEAQNNLLEVEQEFDEHRKKSLEREQKLRRQLQDEVNKHRNN